MTWIVERGEAIHGCKEASLAYGLASRKINSSVVVHDNCFSEILEISKLNTFGRLSYQVHKRLLNMHSRRKIYRAN